MYNYSLIIVFTTVFQLTLSINLAELGLNIAKKYTTKILENSGDSSECTAHLKDVIGGVLKRELWGVEMIDASAKLQSGLFEGNIRHVGNFDECLAINKNIRNGSVVKGKYCTVLVTPSKYSSGEFKKLWDVSEMLKYKDIKNDNYMEFVNVKVSWGICIPASCSSKSLQKIWDYSERLLNLSVHLYFEEDLCSFEGKPRNFTAIDLFAMFFFGFVCFVAFGSTVCDLLCGGTFGGLWKAFSFYSNGRKLFFAKAHSESLACINGIRVLSILGIALSHRFFLMGLRPNINNTYLFEWKKNVSSIPILASFMFVDTFFTISGLLLTYIFFRTSESGIKITTVRLYVHRILRLSPAAFALVLLYAGMLKFLASGPVWPSYGLLFSEQCKRNGFYTMLYLNNYVPFSQQCTGHLWYLSLDTQMYALSPIILFSIKNNERKVIYGIVTVIVLSVATAFVVTWRNQFGVSVFQFNEPFVSYVYESTFIRIPPWLIGIVFGYILHQQKHSGFSLTKNTVQLLWTLCASTTSLIIYGFYRSNAYDYNVLLASLVNAAARPAWGLCVCWVVFACVNGHGGPINRFLSANAFVVLARLNYAMYLVHVPVQALLIFSVMTPGYISNFGVVHEFFGDVVVIFLVAVVWNLLFESPILAFERVVFRIWGESFTKRDE